MYYVYMLVRPNGKPFYVGKGKDDRVFDHEKEARNGHQSHKCNVIRKIWRDGGEVQRYTVFTTDDEAEALAYECTMIALLGRSTLTNHTDGGEGTSGMKWSRETRAKINAIMNDPAHREANSARTKALWNDPDYRRRVTETIRTQAADPEFRAAVSATKKAEWQDPEIRAKYMADRQSPKRREQARAQMKRQVEEDPQFNEKGLAVRRTPEGRAKHSAIMSEEHRRRWADPEYRAKMTAIRKEQGARDREKNAAAIRRKWEDPEYRAKQDMANKRKWEDPAFRAKYTQGIKERDARNQAKRAALQNLSTHPSDLGDAQPPLSEVPE